MLLIQLRDFLLVVLYEAPDLFRLVTVAPVDAFKLLPPAVQSGLILAQQRITSQCHARKKSDVRAVANGRLQITSALAANSSCE